MRKDTLYGVRFHDFHLCGRKKMLNRRCARESASRMANGGRPGPFQPAKM